MKSLLFPLVISVVLIQGLPTHTDTKEGELLTELDAILTQISSDLSTGKDGETVPRVEKRKDYAPLIPHQCPNGNIQCDWTRVCVPASAFCNNQANCPGGWDEQPNVCREVRNFMERSLKERNSLDKRGKTSSSSRKCRAGMIPCAAGTLCIPADYVCDGLEDCPDATDELNCGCAAGHLQCNQTGECITQSRLCDGRSDCRDGEDETEKTCGSRRCRAGTTRCPTSNLCVDDSLWCDGTDHCGDGGDEDRNRCQKIPCDGLRCASSGRCLATERYCDNFQDCPEGEDEDVSRCGPVSCPPDTAQCGGTNYCYRVPHWACDGYKDCPQGEDEEKSNCEEAGEKNWNYIHKRTSATDLSRLLQLLKSTDD